MKKRNILIIIIIIVIVIGLVAYNIHLNNLKRANNNDFVVVKNRIIKGEHCIEDAFCLKDVEIVYDKAMKEVYVGGNITNLTSTNYDKKVDFIFETKGGSHTVTSEVHLKPFEKRYYEAHYKDKEIMKVENYSMREVN